MRVALAAELGIRKVVIPCAADVFSAWGMLMSDLRRDFFLTRLLESLAPGDDRALDGCSRGPAHASRASSSPRASRPSDVRFHRYGKLRYENQEHSVEVPLPDGPIDADCGRARSPSASTTRTSASTPTGSTRRSSSSARTSSRSRRSASSSRRTLPSTGRPLDETRQGPPAGRLRDRGHPYCRHLRRATCSSRGCEFTGPAIVETKGTTDRRHAREAQSTVDDVGNLVIDSPLGEAEA